MTELDLARMEDRSSPERWGERNAERDRRVYFDAERSLYLKVWGPQHEDHRMMRLGQNEFVVTSQVIVGFAIGFFDATTAPAYVDTIVDDDGLFRGYITRAGEPFIGRADPRLPGFLATVEAATRRSGFAHTDVCYNNIVSVGDDLSFVDFDTVFSQIALMDEEHERQVGAFREHVYPEYREFLQNELLRLRGEIEVAS